MNNNLVRKPKKDEDEFEEEEEEDLELDDDSSSKRSSSDVDPRKRLFLLMGIMVGVVVLILLVLFIASLFTNKKYEYEDIETILKEAAISYFADHPESLPQEEGSVVEIDAANLVYAGKMKDLAEYRNDGVVCTGSVQVEKAGTEYLYTPFLNCGDNYYSVELYNKIESDNPVTSSGDGLYNFNRGLVFRGENLNNYVKLDNSLWRIVKIDSDGYVVLIHATGIDYYQPWDDRYNEERLFESGVNNYSISRISDYLQKVYVNPDEENGETILSDKDRARIVSYSLCIGSKDADSESKTNSEECSKKAKDQKLGLLTLSEYLYASLDPSCKSANTKSCMNYNYLSMDDEWWLATANKADTSTVFKVNRNGVVTAVIASTYSKVRPVIYLNNRVMYAGGTGTEEDPYTVK